MRSVITSSCPFAWTSSARILSTPADFPFLNGYTAASAALRRWGRRRLCLSWDSPALMDLHWPCNCTAQSSILSKGSVSPVLLRQFPERSWIVVAFPCFTVVTSFTSWYALLLLFFLRFSSVSMHCSPIQFSFAFIYFPVFLRFSVLSFCRTDQLDINCYPGDIHKDSTDNSSIDKLESNWNDRSISLSSKIRLIRSLVTSIFLYVCESWTLTAEL